MRHSSILIIIIFQVIFGSNTLFAEPFSRLSQLKLMDAKVSAVVLNLNTKKIIAELSPNLRLSPASVTKLVIGAKSLETWGTDKTFSSQIFMRGVLKNNVLHGDLIFYGGGDPYLTNEKLWFLTSDVSRFGITKVTGNIIVNTSLFGPILEDENRASGRDHSENAYDSPLSSAAVNFSVLAFVVNPAQKIGQKATIAIEPYATQSVKIINNVTTSKIAQTKIFVARNSIKGTDTFNISGNIGITNPTYRVYRSISNPDQYSGEVLNAFLKYNGVQTLGTVKIENTPLLATDNLVSNVQSFPLNWQLKGLFEMSNNFIADMLTLNLGVHYKIPKSVNPLMSSSTVLENYMHQIVNHWDEPQNQLVLHSGSGLTTDNRLSANDVCSLLTKMYHNTNLFPEYLSALASPGGSGTLKNRFKRSNLSENIMLRAKSGTLREPFDVASLAGYSRLNNGDWIAFAILVNSTPKNSLIDLEHMRSAIDSDLSQILTLEQK